MVELGADHVTLGEPTLSDLLHTQCPAHKAGQFKIPISDQMNQPEFIWEDWKPTVPEESKRRMAEIAKSDPVSGLMSKDFKIADPSLDYVDGNALEDAIKADEVARTGLEEGLHRFRLMEEASRDEILRLQKELA